MSQCASTAAAPWPPSSRTRTAVQWEGFTRTRTSEAYLATIDFDGHQYELAELVKHALQASLPDKGPGKAWDKHLVTRGVHKQGRDPHRHEIGLLDAFLTPLTR